MGRSSTTAKPGDMLALKWTEEVVTQKLQAIYDCMTDDQTGTGQTNPVRANDIKFIYEAALCCKVSASVFEYWLRKVKKGEEGTFWEAGGKASELVADIKKISELRLCYSGKAMDMVMLKKHFNYRNKHEVHNTTTSVSANAVTVAKLAEMINNNHKID